MDNDEKPRALTPEEMKDRRHKRLAAAVQPKGSGGSLRFAGGAMGDALNEYSAVPKNKLVSLAGVIRTLAKLSDGKVSIGEFCDALVRRYDPNGFMLYDGFGYGMADQIGSDDNEFHGKVQRGKAIRALFASHFWENPRATILDNVPVDTLMVKKVDSVEIARDLWLRFFDTELPQTAIVDGVVVETQNLGETHVVIAEPEIDQSDLPPELDAANMAFRAYTLQYGDSTLTPKNWLLKYVAETNKGLFKPEQVERIATIANPDKTTGRKKRAKE